MKKVFLVLAVVAAIGLGVGYPLDNDAFRGIGAIAAIFAGLMGAIMLVLLFLRKTTK